MKNEAGKGSLYRPVTKKYGKNYERLYGKKKLNLWPRDKNGKLKDE